MIKKILACWAALAILLAFNTPGHADVQDEFAAKRQWTEMIVQSMTLEGMEVTLLYSDCGVVNAYYFMDEKTVVICNELIEEESFSVLRFVVAHEMAHAIIVQKDLPYTGSHEDAADELASVYLYVNEMAPDIYAAAEWFYQYREYEAGPFDDHTAPLQRAYRLNCYFVGATSESFNVCSARFSKALRTWDRLLKM